MTKVIFFRELIFRIILITDYMVGENAFFITNNMLLTFSSLLSFLGLLRLGEEQEVTNVENDGKYAVVSINLKCFVVQGSNQKVKEVV